MPPIRSTIGLEEAGPMGGIEGSKTLHLGDRFLSCAAAAPKPNYRRGTVVVKPNALRRD